MKLAFWRRRRPEIVCQQWVEVVTTTSRERSRRPSKPPPTGT